MFLVCGACTALWRTSALVPIVCLLLASYSYRENILNSMYQLWILGALDNTGEVIVCDLPLFLSALAAAPVLHMHPHGALLGCWKPVALALN